MNTVIINEQQLQSEIDALKPQFPDTKDIYREVCMLLFFRYGITPTANKLYQYVRRGSMSAPAEALNKFWLELRDKSRVRIERPDIPENIAVAAGDLISILWNEAQNAAQAGFSQLIAKASDEVLLYKGESEISREDLSKIQLTLNETEENLKIAIQRASEMEKLNVVDTSTLVAQEKSLKTLQIEKNELSSSMVNMKASFSKDITVISQSLNMAEERYTGLEKKSLLELDNLRQQVKKLDKQLSESRNKSASDQSLFIKSLSKHQSVISELNEKTGILTGIVSELKKQLKLAERKIARYESNKSKHQSTKRK